MAYLPLPPRGEVAITLPANRVWKGLSRTKIGRMQYDRIQYELDGMHYDRMGCTTIGWDALRSDGMGQTREHAGLV